MKVALVAPHLYLRKEFAGKVIFSPGELFVWLANGLAARGVEVHTYTCGRVGSLSDAVTQHIADDKSLQLELRQRGYGLAELYAKHPLACLTIARQMQSEVIAQAYHSDADITHVYMNEEEIALSFASLATMPVVFTHHEPYNYLLKYRSVFPNYASKRAFISISKSQRASLPQANWVGNVYHGLPVDLYHLRKKKAGYFAFLGRIIEPKGVHLAIQAALLAGVKLKIAGKHYSQSGQDGYWDQHIKPFVDGKQIEYVGFLSKVEQKQEFLGNARALVMPSTWEEPFGMVAIEAFACGTPVISLDRGALPEILSPGINGVKVELREPKDYKTKQVGIGGFSQYANNPTIEKLAESMLEIDSLVKSAVKIRESFEERFSLEKMVAGHLEVYRKFTER